MSTSIPLTLLNENGKQITVTASAGHPTIGFIVWSKNGTPKLPLNLSISEAKGLRRLLDSAINKAETT